MNGMVVAAQPEAVEAGAQVLARGGNAVDAAVATALVQTAVDPQMCGIAGFGSMHVYVPGGAHETIDCTPDPQRRLTVMAGTSLGMPPSMAATRAR